MNKHILALTLLGFSIPCFSQIPHNIMQDNEAAREYLLKIINDFRKDNGRAPLEWRAEISLACDYHTRYLALYDRASHNQDLDDLSDWHENILSPSDRINKFCSDHIDVNYRGEVVALHSGTLNSASSQENKHFEIMYEVAKKSEDPDIYIWSCHIFLELWKSSPPHKKILLDSKSTKMGASIYLYDSIKFDRMFNIAVVVTSF